MNKSSIYISKGSKSPWKLIFPAICFLLALYIIFQSFSYVPKESQSSVEFFLVSILTVMPLLVVSIVFSTVKDFHFDFINKKYKIVKRIGFLGFGKWRTFETLNYISVYKTSDNFSEIKLWYNENKHYSIDIYRNEQEAINKGKELAKNLNLNIHTPDVDYEYSENKNEPIEIPENLRVIDAHISEGTRPFWHIILAALFFTGAFFSLILFYETFTLEMNKKNVRSYFDILELVMLLIIFGISFSLVKDYQFDFKNNQYKIISRIGPVKIGRWQSFKSLDYISVFKKDDYEYIINLWYNTNKHFSFCISNNSEKALKIGSELSKKLKIDLLDATNPHNKKWVEVTNP